MHSGGESAAPFSGQISTRGEDADGQWAASERPTWYGRLVHRFMCHQERRSPKICEENAQRRAGRCQNDGESHQKVSGLGCMAGVN